MIKVEKDGIYRAIRVRSGSGERGDWELVAIADENNDKRQTTIFVENNPCGAIENQLIKVKEIVSVKIGWKKDSQGQWKPDTTLSAVIEPIQSEIDVGDGDLPWDSGDDWDKLPL